MKRLILIIALLSVSQVSQAGAGDPLHPSNSLITPYCFKPMIAEYCIGVWNFPLVGNTFAMVTNKDGTWKWLEPFSDMSHDSVMSSGGVEAYWERHLPAWNAIIKEESSFPGWEKYMHDHLNLVDGQLILE